MVEGWTFGAICGSAATSTVQTSLEIQSCRALQQMALSHVQNERIAKPIFASCDSIPANRAANGGCMPGSCSMNAQGAIHSLNLMVLYLSVVQRPYFPFLAGV